MSFRVSTRVTLGKTAMTGKKYILIFNNLPTRHYNRREKPLPLCGAVPCGGKVALCGGGGADHAFTRYSFAGPSARDPAGTKKHRHGYITRAHCEERSNLYVCKSMDPDVYSIPYAGFRSPISAGFVDCLCRGCFVPRNERGVSSQYI
jgi:hypothetical protein